MGKLSLKYFKNYFNFRKHPLEVSSVTSDNVQSEVGDGFSPKQTTDHFLSSPSPIVHKQTLSLISAPEFVTGCREETRYRPENAQSHCKLQLGFCCSHPEAKTLSVNHISCLVSCTKRQDTCLNKIIKITFGD